MDVQELILLWLFFENGSFKSLHYAVFYFFYFFAITFRIIWFRAHPIRILKYEIF